MTKVAVGLMEGLPSVEVELTGTFNDERGARVGPGRHHFASETTLSPVDPISSAFALDGVPIGIGFHWERKERQVFRGGIRILRRGTGLTVINDVPLEEYVTSVISSEMSASCPPELLKAHAVISRSWLKGPSTTAPGAPETTEGPGSQSEIRRWYGREAHPDFEVCADDHCQRYQGTTKAVSPAVADAIRSTSGEMLFFGGAICDARFSKCCGGLTERYQTAWDDQEIPYLTSVFDGPPQPGASDPEKWIRSNPAAFCNTRDADLLGRILPGFDQETQNFFRWRVEYTPEELGEVVRSKLNIDLGSIMDLEPLARGPSGRIYRLRISGRRGSIVVGKELEIRRALSRSHLYSSAFVADLDAGQLILKGAGWGHGVGLCQIGAAVMAAEGRGYREILSHYYPGTTINRVTGLRTSRQGSRSKVRGMKLSAYGKTDIGRRRTNNEDGYVIRDLTRETTFEPEVVVEELVGGRGVLLAVCDGIGGHHAGEVASSLALDTLETEMQQLSDACPRPELFKKAVEVVNRRVWTEASLHAKLSGMGTTLTAAVICNERVLIAHVGDSRAYFARDGRVEKITKDQSIAGQLVASGAMTEEQAQETPFRHVLLQAIGTKEKVEIALDGIDLVRGDTLLLCSDGLSGKVGIADLVGHLSGNDVKVCGNALVALANERGGEDNVTVVIARVS